MSWLRRLLLLAGLMTGAWLLGSAGEASADVKIEIDHLNVEVRLPVVDVAVKVATVPQRPEAPVPSQPDPRVETPAPAPATPQKPQPVVEAPVLAEASPQQQSTPPPPSTTRPTNPAPVPQQPQPQAEQPITGTLPQSGAGQAGGNQIPAGTLPHAMRPPTATTSLVSSEQLDVPRNLRAEEPTFSPD